MHRRTNAAGVSPRAARVWVDGWRNLHHTRAALEDVWRPIALAIAAWIPTARKALAAKEAIKGSREELPPTRGELLAWSEVVMEVVEATERVAVEVSSHVIRRTT